MDMHMGTATDAVFVFGTNQARIGSKPAVAYSLVSRVSAAVPMATVPPFEFRTITPMPIEGKSCSRFT